MTAAGKDLDLAGLSGSPVEALLPPLSQPRPDLQEQLQAVLRDPQQQLGAVLIYQVVPGHLGAPKVVPRHHQLLLPVIEGCGGRVIQTVEEAAVALFPNAARAVDAAVALQQEVSDGPADAHPESTRMRLRIGVHFGALRDGAGGWPLGGAVLTAAHVQRYAGPLQVLVSDAVRAQLPATLPLTRLSAVPTAAPEDPLVLHEISWRQLGRANEDLPRIDPRYRVDSKLGSGGMASVWRARDERLGREVAIKVLHRNLPFSSSMKERLQREARVAAALTHENIVQVYDVVASEVSDSYIAMELVEGRTLRDYVERLGALPSFPATLIAYEVARGVGFAHSRGVVHRDVKPDNVLISSHGAVKVGDFGIAVMEELVRLTASGVPVGTPAYLSPEQVKGERADARSDVFSFGVMLYEIATGKLPFNGASSSAVMYKIVEGGYLPPESHQPLEPELAQVIRRCLKRAPQDRFQNITEILEVFRPLLQRWSVVDPRATLASYLTEGNLLHASGAEGGVDKVPTLASPRVGGRGWRRAARVAVPVAALILGGAVTFGLLRAGEKTLRPTDTPTAPTSAITTVPSAITAAPSAGPTAPSATPTAPSAITTAPAPSPLSTPQTPLPEQSSPPSVASRPRPVRVAPVRPSTGQRAAEVEAVPPPVVASAPGTLHLVLQGAWADIVVDGKPKGRSPPVRDLSLPPGEHLIELRNPHRAPFQQTVRIDSGAEQVLRAEFQPLP